MSILCFALTFAVIGECIITTNQVPRLHLVKKEQRTNRKLRKALQFSLLDFSSCIAL